MKKKRKKLKAKKKVLTLEQQERNKKNKEMQLLGKQALGNLKITGKKINPYDPVDHFFTEGQGYFINKYTI